MWKKGSDIDGDVRESGHVQTDANFIAGAVLISQECRGLITTPDLSYGPISEPDLNITRRDGDDPYWLIL